MRMKRITKPHQWSIESHTPLVQELVRMITVKLQLILVTPGPTTRLATIEEAETSDHQDMLIDIISLIQLNRALIEETVIIKLEEGGGTVQLSVIIANNLTTWRGIARHL